MGYKIIIFQIMKEDEGEQLKNKNQNERRVKCGLREGCIDINNYTRLNRIYEGTYGVVYRAIDQHKNGLVAIKKLKLVEGQDFPITSLRQIAILKTINHQNIIKIHKISGNQQRNRVFIVMEYMEHQIKELLKLVTFSEHQIRRLMKDLLLGINHLHSRNIVHRDIKTSNLLYSNQGILKICDFGLSRRVQQAMMTQQVTSLWYRAPQLLLGPIKYEVEIDIWSVGCILAELALSTSLFQGKSQLEQLDRIFKILGSPTNESFPNFKEMKNGMYVIGNKYPESKLRQSIPKDKLSDLGLDLLNKLLTPYPKKRITAQKALKHEWFKQQMSKRENMPKLQAINQIDRVKKVKQQKQKI